MQQLDFSSVGAIPATLQPKDKSAPQKAGMDFSSLGAIPAGGAPAQNERQAGGDGLSMPTIQELSIKTPETEHEGLYRMKDEHGNLYGVPYSNVEQVENFRNNFVDEKEAERYEKDHRSSSPGLWARARTAILDATEPTTAHKNAPKTLTGGMLAQQEVQTNALKRVGRDLFGIVDMGPQAYKSFQKAISDDPKVSEEGEHEIWSLHPGSQIVDRVREFKQDYKKDPNLAFANTAGDAFAFYVADKLGEVARKAPKVVIDKVGEGIKNRAGTGVKSTEKLVRDTAASNEAVGPEAERVRKENDEVIAKAKTKAEKEHADKVADVRRKNEEKTAAAQKKHADAVEAVDKANEATLTGHEDAVAERNDLVEKHVDATRKAAEMRTRLHNHLQDIHQSAEKYFANQYDTLGDLTKDTRVDFSPLVEAVEEGKLQDIAGSDTKVPVFEDVMRRAKGEKGVGGQKPEGWEDLAPDEKQMWAREHANDNGITYKDLVGYHRELGKILKSSSTPVDVKDAIVRVRHTIEEMQTEAAKKADVEAAAKAAEQKKAKPPSAAQLNYAISEQYKNFAESYRDPGAEGTKAIKAGNAHEATKPYLAENISPEQLSEIKQRARGKEPLEAGRKTNATKWAGRNSAADTAGKRLTTKQRRAQTEKLIDQARKAHDDLRALPKPGEPLTPPELAPPPEPGPAPKLIPEPEFNPKEPTGLKKVPEVKTLSQKELQLYKREQLNKKIDQLESTGMRIGVRGFGTITLAGLVTHLIGGGTEATAAMAGGAATVAFLGPKVFAKLLKMPGVAESLLTITKADVEALEKLPANQRVEAEQMIVNLAQAAKMNGTIKPSDPTPLAKWAKADMAKQAAAPAETEAVVEPADPERGAVEVKLPVRAESSSGQAAEPAQAAPEAPPVMPAPSSVAKPAEEPPAALPGMESAVAKQHEAAGEFKTEEQRKEAETSLATSKGNIDKAAGEMERNSPLFRDSGASGQGGLFGGGEEQASIPSYDDLLQKHAGVPRNLVAPDVTSDTEFLERVAHTPAKGAAEARKAVADFVRGRYEKVAETVRSLPQRITVYRSVHLPGGIETLNAEKLGQYWSDKEEGAGSYWKKNDEGQSVMLRAVADKAGVDMNDTLRARMKVGHGARESEVTMAGGYNPESVEYKLKDGNEWKTLPSKAPPTPVAEPRNDHQPSRRLEDLKVDPKRFQYKLGGNKQGVTDALSDAKWDQDLADPIHIWEDPETGEEFVVNGHHRYELAQQAGAERIHTNSIDNTKVRTASEAREYGAMKNIADGNGTSVDAAKFFRENGLTPADLKARGLSLKKAVANEGVALSRLSDGIFDRVVDGKIEPKIGAAIGEASDVASDQEAILKDVQRREKAGRPVTPEQIRESARLIRSSPTFTETTQDLFGSHEEERNLFLEMGEVSEYIQRELADEKRTFKRVSSKGASDQLAKGKNVINPEENARIAREAAQQRELYLKRSAQAGPIHAALQEAAERLAEGGNPNETKQAAFDEIRQHLSEELGQVE